jgi:hypothetical protein
MKTIEHLIQRCWTGSIKLWQAFWLLGVLGQLLVFIAVAVLMAAFVQSPAQNMITYGFLVLGFIGYAVLASVSIWRSADNTDTSAMGALARVVVVFYWIGVAKIVYVVNTLHAASRH